MFGKNPILKPVKGSGDYLEVKKIFKTFQGEGFYVGYPAIFIRLSGCNLNCSFCDTDFDASNKKSLQQIITQVKKLSTAKDQQRKFMTHNLVVITGGEPMRQPIAKLCEQLLKEKYLLQIETNGTLFIDLPNEVKIICSPKNYGGGYKKIRADLLPKISAIKFIISKSNNLYNNVSEVGQSDYDIPVYVQPMDQMDKNKNRDNVKLALQIAEEKGYRISLQIHKILNIE